MVQYIVYNLILWGLYCGPFPVELTECGRLCTVIVFTIITLTYCTHTFSVGCVEIKIIQQILLRIFVVQTSYTKMRAESLFVLQLFDQYECRVQKTYRKK